MRVLPRAMRSLLPMLVVTCLVGSESARALDLSAGYAWDREHGTDLVATGFSAGLSQGLGEHLFMAASYARLRTEPFADGALSGRLEYTSAAVELGAGAALSQYVGLSISGGYAGSETRGLDDFRDDPVQRAYGPVGALTLGIQLGQFSLLGGPSYTYVGRVPGWQRNAGLRLALARRLHLNAGYWSGDVAEGWNAGLSVNFGAN